MRAIALLFLIAPALAQGLPRGVSLLNVDVVDAKGTRTALSGFHLANGENRFQGFLGSGNIEVAYDRLHAIRVLPPARPGGRMRATLILRSGKEVHATFDEREGEVLLTGFAKFGRVSIFFRDIRELKILGKTKRADLPTYGKPSPGVDTLVRDRQGVVTELVGFRRATGENVIPCVRGAASVSIPLRIVKHVRLVRDKRSPMLAGTATLRNDSKVTFHIPIYAERYMLRGSAEFGAYRIELGEVRELVVRRPTPVLRDIDPVAVAGGSTTKEEDSAR